jgi:hypothetical protein
MPPVESLWVVQDAERRSRPRTLTAFSRDIASRVDFLATFRATGTGGKTMAVINLQFDVTVPRQSHQEGFEQDRRAGGVKEKALRGALRDIDANTFAIYTPGAGPMDPPVQLDETKTLEELGIAECVTRRTLPQGTAAPKTGRSPAVSGRDAHPPDSTSYPPSFRCATPRIDSVRLESRRLSTGCQHPLGDLHGARTVSRARANGRQPAS